MKFKYFIILFSSIIVIAILAASLLFVLSPRPELIEYLSFLVLPSIFFIVLILVCVAVFFLLNYRLFSLLEREDWPALAYYLENKIYTKGRYSAKKVRLLAGSYLVILDYDSVFKLENKAMHAKPSVIDKNILIFGAARILNGNLKEAVDFFRLRLEKAKPYERQWIRLFYGFSLLLCGAYNGAEQEFSAITVSSKNALICGLSAYFLGTSILNHSKEPEKCKNIVENSRVRVIKRFKNLKGWEKEAKKMGTDIHVAIIKRYIDEAGEWLFTPVKIESGKE